LKYADPYKKIGKNKFLHAVDFTFHRLLPRHYTSTLAT